MDETKNALEWGETIYAPKEEVNFSFSYDIQERHHVLNVTLDIPLKKSVEELAYRLISSHGVPCYMCEHLIHSLDTFVKNKTKEFNSKIKNNLFSTINQSGVKERLSKQWSNCLNKGEVIRHGGSSLSFDTSWSDIYHKLIHSPALEALLQLEHSYSIAMKEIVTKRDKELKELQDKHLVTMELTVEKVGATKNNSDVNNLAADQLEESQMLETYWSSALSDLQETQKREYRQWVLTVHEKIMSDETFNDIAPGLRYNRSDSVISFQVVNQQETLLEESFTIHLGTQMKTMHNIRLVCRDILDYCQCKVSYVGGNMVPHPQRLQTAMSLYSQSLSALFLLVDDRFDGLNGIKRDFRQICNESTEFHFPNYEKQVCLIEQTLQDRPSRKRTLRTSSFMQNEENNSEVKKTTSLLQTGDFYITKHSNLAEVHAVFHLVTDSSVTQTSINSRHPIMIGIRNIMLAAARHNITNIIIPLLLVHEMMENFTLQWCMKRAELVLKCVKGFMMESLSWDGHESRTLQFVVPPGISEDMFIAFSNMLPSIFRVSNPLDLSNVSVKLN